MLSCLKLQPSFCRSKHPAAAFSQLARAATVSCTRRQLWQSCVHKSTDGYRRSTNRVAAQPRTSSSNPEPSNTEQPEAKQWQLLAAAQQQQWEICQQLLNEGVSDPKYIRCVAAMYAAGAGQTQLALDLMQSAAAVSIFMDADKQGVVAGAHLEVWHLEEALQSAAIGGEVPTCPMLMDALPALLGTSLENAVYEATRRGYNRVFLFIWDACRHNGEAYQRVIPDLSQQVVRGIPDTIGSPSAGVENLNILIDKGFDVNAGQSGFQKGGLLAKALDERNLKIARILIDRGAHVHADPMRLKSESALCYAIRSHELDACKLLLSFKHVVVGGAELCVAVLCGNPPVIQLVLNSEANLKQDLTQDHQERGEWLAKALELAVRESVRELYQCAKCGEYYEDAPDAYMREEFYDYFIKETEEVMMALLAPPAHWYPLPPSILERGVREAVQILKRYKTHNGLGIAIRVLAKAGADLGIDGGALLKAAVKANSVEVLKVLAEAGVDIER